MPLPNRITASAFQPSTGALEYICIHQMYELHYWCERLDASPGELVEAVLTVGDRVDRVQAHLALQAARGQAQTAAVA